MKPMVALKLKGSAMVGVRRPHVKSVATAKKS
ncbi:hypothetical protein Sinac_4271 [Singulisphaera acidiphila DSM 18658]|uniref:Uncharacterized protein n=1 Tax=Singulisphaera acidiphila (strain ATCC BAA-1392 / DSM 18658 / VKM B-2454 / MOB10) TaxID=886293 RepID=L0DHZ1_SINAD|nr:hypothetical protein Sinac_4271 [Singulisphaera acidiphila DSM 18658]